MNEERIYELRCKALESAAEAFPGKVPFDPNPDPILWNRIHKSYEKFAEVIVKECARLNLELSYELAGVIIDTEEGIGFDSVCLNTVKQVHNSLANRQLIEHFGVEE